MEFVLVKQYKNWAEYDCYGEPIWEDNILKNKIKNKDRIEIEWPDGTFSLNEVTVEEYSTEGRDRIGVSNAYIYEKLRGELVKVRLANTQIKIRKI